jgi:ATP-dependent RNA helicase DDX19/DBP5
LKVQELTVKGISQMYMDCPGEADKYEILCKLYGLMNIGSSIIFVKVWDRLAPSDLVILLTIPDT